jgi:hypothetical protein
VLAAQGIIDQIFQLWIEPELVRRDLTLDRDQVHTALVVLSPGTGPSVYLNDEASFVAEATASKPISAGDPVSTSDISEILGIRPVNIDLDAGWVGFVQVGGVRFVAFDFRRNRDRARRLIALGFDFLETARSALELGRLGPAIENAFAAAELGVTAQVLLINDAPTKDHPTKQRWFRSWTELGNAPQKHSKALATLASLRKAARYGGKKLKTEQSVIVELLDDVRDLVLFAQERVDEGSSPAIL